MNDFVTSHISLLLSVIAMLVLLHLHAMVVVRHDIVIMGLVRHVTHTVLLFGVQSFGICYLTIEWFYILLFAD